MESHIDKVMVALRDHELHSSEELAVLLGTKTKQVHAMMSRLVVHGEVVRLRRNNRSFYRINGRPCLLQRHWRASAEGDHVAIPE